MDACTVRVVVADPQPMFRYGLKRLLDETEHLRVVGEADDAEQATETVRRCEADVLVISRGNLRNGLDALQALDRPAKPLRCIVVTNGDRQGTEATAWPLPVVGALPRESPGSAFVACIQAVMQAGPSGRESSERPPVASAADWKAPQRLTPREVQIVCALADGASNKDIGAQLSIAEDTVKRHLSNIFNKVGVDSRLELTVFAMYHGLVEWT